MGIPGISKVRLGKGPNNAQPPLDALDPEEGPSPTSHSEDGRPTEIGRGKGQLINKYYNRVSGAGWSMKPRTARKGSPRNAI